MLGTWESHLAVCVSFQPAHDIACKKVWIITSEALGGWESCVNLHRGVIKIGEYTQTVFCMNWTQIRFAHWFGYWTMLPELCPVRGEVNMCLQYSNLPHASIGWSLRCFSWHTRYWDGWHHCVSKSYSMTCMPVRRSSLCDHQTILCCKYHRLQCHLMGIKPSLLQNQDLGIVCPRLFVMLRAGPNSIPC